VSHPDYTYSFRPTATWDALRLRADLLKRLRALFEERGFLEVETPLLSADTVVDRYIEPLRVNVDGCERFLQTSPEFAMKRLLAAGGTALFQICKAFRGGEQGRLHNREFTMVEWYRVGDGYVEGMQLLSDLAEEMLRLGPAERTSYREAFRTHAGVDPFVTPMEKLIERCRERCVSIPESLSNSDRDGWLNLMLAEFVEPQLGKERPTILYDYPASQAALARVRSADRQEGTCRLPGGKEHATAENDESTQLLPGRQELLVAERFELYVRGLELANGFHELLDPEILRERNRENNRLRNLDGKAELPEESRLLAAMESGLPPCTGVALGFDRLVMIAAGASSLAEVMAFTSERA
jgi:lysyl-tRNA synthetase class 2